MCVQKKPAIDVEDLTGPSVRTFNLSHRQQANSTLKLKSLVVRVKGGLGNQLFCYAAARRLAFANDAELAIDDVSGFTRDRKYRRRYSLGQFAIPARRATAYERMVPFERARRAITKAISARRPFEERRYIEQEGIDFDARVLHVKLRPGRSYIDGLWQSERYFKDIEGVIRDDLRITSPPPDAANQSMAKSISSACSVALHVRWFNTPSDVNQEYQVSSDYYRDAIALMRKSVSNPHFFLFSDNPSAAIARHGLTGSDVTVVEHNSTDPSGHADLWLMSQCRHFILANSTFSWWGAWLGVSDDKIVIAPKQNIGTVTAWGFEGQLPQEWIVLS